MKTTPHTDQGEKPSGGPHFTGCHPRSRSRPVAPCAQVGPAETRAPAPASPRAGKAGLPRTPRSALRPPRPPPPLPPRPASSPAADPGSPPLTFRLAHSAAGQPIGCRPPPRQPRAPLGAARAGPRARLSPWQRYTSGPRGPEPEAAAPHGSLGAWPSCQGAGPAPREQLPAGRCEPLRLGGGGCLLLGWGGRGSSQKAPGRAAIYLCWASKE